MSSVGPRFVRRDWTDGTVLFDRWYGDTHTLNQSTRCVFQALLDNPEADDSSLGNCLATQLPAIPASDILTCVAEARTELERTGLA